MMRAIGLVGIAAAQEVIVGTVANFDDLVASNPGGLLAEFYAPWCGHCKKLEPEYDSAAKMLHEAGIKVPLVKVDTTVEEALQSKYEVRGYPTLKWFVNGQANEYDGPRVADGIFDWIKSMTGPVVVESAPDADASFSATWYGNEVSESFDAVAGGNRKKAKWHWVKGGEDKVVFKHKGEPELTWTVSSEQTLEEFFKVNSFPLFGKLDEETFGNYMDRGNGMLWTLMDMTADNVSEVVEAHREDMTKVAKALGTDYSVTWTNTVEFAKVLDSMLGVSEFPKVVVQKKVGDKKNFIYDGEITADAVLAYVEKVKSGELTANLKSEPVPEEPQADPVKVVVGKTVETLVFSKEKDVLLEIYAPWCGHCKKLDPEYIKVAKKVVKEGFEDILTIAKMDGTLNDSPVDAITWSGFPTLFYVKAGETAPMTYDGARDAKGIWKWIKKNHSKADKIKEKMAAKESKESKDSKPAAKEEL